MEDALRRIVALAPGLKEAQLRCLLELATRAGNSNEVSCSSRDLARVTGVRRQNVQAALDSLCERGLIATDGGTATRASRYRLHFLTTLVLPERGSTAEPPTPRQVALLQGHPGSFSEPQGGFAKEPPGGSAVEPHPRARVENSESIELLDRVLRATPKKFEDAARDKAKEWIYGYMRKFGRERDPHPPDDQIVAQFLAVAPWPDLENLLMRLFRENCEAGRTYAWFVFVALDRLHGIKGSAIRQRKAELHLVAARSAISVDELRGEIRSLAAVKGMR